MITINNKQEWIGFCKSRYPDSETFTPKIFPPAYPCQAKMENIDGGIGGDYTAFQVRYVTGIPHAKFTPWETIFSG